MGKCCGLHQLALCGAPGQDHPWVLLTGRGTPTAVGILGNMAGEGDIDTPGITGRGSLRGDSGWNSRLCP